MSVDLACAAPAFLDLTFTGLAELPGPGQERHADALHRSPGGGAITAIGAARLGLRPRWPARSATTTTATFLRAALEGEGIRVSGAVAERTPVTVVVPVAGDRAMITYDPGTPVRRATSRRSRRRPWRAGSTSSTSCPRAR